ncbi:AsmA family protein [Massilia sp. Se16.2.3]|uniref:AsmA family protein n=1 Tax=Massilia sp. Se16.2.3 TaxID=2709303 RepID=UPI0028054E65|nr:AsmA family protein [Massilia sp. Se16.2.3]
MPDTTSPPGTAKQHGGHKKKKILFGVLATLIAIPVIAVIFILTFDWNRARPWLNAKVSEAIERPFAIRGNLAVQWEVPARSMAPSDRHLRDWLPWPHLIANDVHVGNPANMKQMDMASVRQFSFSLNPFGLLHHTIGIPVLRFDSPRVELQRTDSTHYNWVYKKEKKESKWELDLERVVLTDGVVRVVDAVTDADITAHVRTLANDPRYGVGFEVTGSYNGAPVTGGGARWARCCR